MRLVLVACSLGAGVASADIVPPRAQAGVWLLDDELRTHEPAPAPERRVEPERAPPRPPPVREAAPLAPVTRKRDRETRIDPIEFVDDTIDAGELHERLGGRTVVKRVVPPPRRRSKP